MPRIRQRLLARAIAFSVPLLNLFRRPAPWPVPLPALAAYPGGSFGRALYDFLHSRGQGYLPGYESHDACHVLLGYGTSVCDELRLQAFMRGNRHATFAGTVLHAMGYCLLPELRPLLARERRRGARAAPLRGIDLAAELHRPLASLQRTLGL